jgi:hypothetical protein
MVISDTMAADPAGLAFGALGPMSQRLAFDPWLALPPGAIAAKQRDHGLPCVGLFKQKRAAVADSFI